MTSGQIKTITWLARLVVGATFIFSGFTKAIDPWGFIFKMEEYLGIWGMSQPRSLIVAAAILIPTVEFLGGVGVLTGCYRRLSLVVTSAFMAMFLPLTFYIWIKNPVSDCGCFGDAWVLSNGATFLKNVVVTALIALLWKWNMKVPTLYLRPVQWLPMTCSTFYIMIIALLGYNIQPILDFRPYPIGTNLAAAEDNINAGSEETPMFVYEKDGEERTFGPDNIPEDTTWHFVKRIEGTESTALADAEGFAIYDGDDEVTDYVIESEGDQIILVIPEPKRAELSYTLTINEIEKMAEERGIGMMALVGGDSEDVEEWMDLSMAAYPCYTSDDTTLKALARGPMALVYVRNGHILQKRSLAMIDLEQLGPDRSAPLETLLDWNPKRLLAKLTCGLIVVFVILFLVQGKHIFRHLAERLGKRTDNQEMA